VLKKLLKGFKQATPVAGGHNVQVLGATQTLCTVFIVQLTLVRLCACCQQALHTQARAYKHQYRGG